MNLGMADDKDDCLRRRRLWRIAGLVVSSGLAACAHYTPLPLATEPALRATLPRLGIAAPQGSGPYPVDAIVALALENNPSLRAIRARRGVAQAQLLQSGILPNPSLSGAILPLLSGAGSVTGWNIGLAQDIKSLITYRTRRRESGFAARQADADILWQEWQVAGQARQIASALIAGERSRSSYQAAFDLFARRNEVINRALNAGNATLIMAAPTRVALQTARASLNALDQRQLVFRHQLNALLGFVPDLVVPLARDLPTLHFEPDTARTNLASIADRRPDLLALRLGYAAQDQNVRAQILSQFPDLVLGAGAASDNSRVINGGPQATIGLPIFNRNQGRIALSQATRIQLNVEYAARLTTVVSEVGALISEYDQLTRQLEVVRRDLPAARLAADRASRAFGSSNLDERSFVELVTNRFAKEQEITQLELALGDRRAALETLLGIGLPSFDTLPTMPELGARR